MRFNEDVGMRTQETVNRMLSRDDLDTDVDNRGPDDAGPLRPGAYIPYAVIDSNFPKIAKAIELMWGHPELDAYLSKLIIDERGGRQGFPHEVARALIALHFQHREQFHFTDNGMWDQVRAVGA